MWFVVFLVNVFYAGIVVGACVLTAVFIFDAPWQSGAATGHLLNVARSCVGLVLAFCCDQ